MSGAGTWGWVHVSLCMPRAPHKVMVESCSTCLGPLDGRRINAPCSPSFCRCYSPSYFLLYPEKKRRKIIQGNQDSSLIPSIGERAAVERISPLSHSPAADPVPATGGGMETLTSRQKSWATNERFYLAAGCWPYRRTLP